MAKTKLICAGAPQVIAADRYFHITGRPSTTAITTENRAQITFNQGGTISNLSVNITANTTTVCNFYVRQNAVNSAVTVSYASGESGIKEDITNTLTVSAGDEINYFADVTSGTSITVMAMSCTFDSTTNTYRLFASTEAPTGQNDNLTRYYYFNHTGNQSVEGNAQCEMLTAGTFKHFFVMVTANTHTTAASNFYLRVNASETGCPTVAYAAAETGIKEDTSTTKAVVDADDCNFKVLTAANSGTTTITFSTISCGFETTNGEYQESAMSNATAVTFNSTAYFPIHGVMSGSTIESEREITLRNGNTDVKELLVEVSVNSITTSPTTIDYRVNRAGNTLQVSFAAGATGTSSTTGTTAVVNGDEVDYRVITPNTAGSITFQQISSLYIATPPPATFNIEALTKMALTGVGA